MKVNSEIIKRFKEKIKIIKEHNDLYYNQDDPQISDAEYDYLKKELLELEKSKPFLKKYGSVKKIIGTPPSNKFKKIKHLQPMLSLSNAFDKKDMKDFIKKMNNFLNLNNKDLELVAEPKIDGISATLIYEKGNLIRGLSRGDGDIGEDILENLKTISTIPKKINANDIPELLEIRCEVYIGKKIFLKLRRILLIRVTLREDL